MPRSVREQVLRGQSEGQREDARGGGAEGRGCRGDGGVWDVRGCAVGEREGGGGDCGDVRGVEFVQEEGMNVLKAWKGGNC